MGVAWLFMLLSRVWPADLSGPRSRRRLARYYNLLPDIIIYNQRFFPARMQHGDEIADRFRAHPNPLRCQSKTPSRGCDYCFLDERIRSGKPGLTGEKPSTPVIGDSRLSGGGMEACACSPD